MSEGSFLFLLLWSLWMQRRWGCVGGHRDERKWEGPFTEPPAVWSVPVGPSWAFRSQLLALTRVLAREETASFLGGGGLQLKHEETRSGRKGVRALCQPRLLYRECFLTWPGTVCTQVSHW